MKRAAHHLTSYGELAPGPGFAKPERLVGLGFRHWLQGYKTGDIASWEKVWCSYSSAMGADTAKTAVGQLSCWVRAINTHAHRVLRSPADCDGFCRDECVAISMIAHVNTMLVQPCAPALSRCWDAR